ncbi:hypothetical protein IJH02_02985 [Candidatus Saccharibacteria bacterium]|nr:hypothetical protein [Candidatus Saccharibacteria bacterium]
MDENGVTTPQMPEFGAQPSMPPEMPMPPVTEAAMPEMGAANVTPAPEPVVTTSDMPEAPAAMGPEMAGPAAASSPTELALGESAGAPQAASPAISEPAAPAPTKPAAKKKKSRGFFDKLKKVDWKHLDVKTLFSGGKKEEELVTGTATTFEINLVPSVKAEAIKALKMRNLVLFICIIVISIAAGITAVLGSVVTGQNVAMAGQDGKLETMSKKINSFEGLSEYLTIQDQLGNIASIQDNRMVLSRVFSFFNVILPTGADKITLSELSINLQDSTMTFTGQADAGVSPFIDYRVLESFKKSAALVKYDYGNYVDANGEDIQTRCMVEANTDGVTFKDGNSVYAYWLKGKTGCEKAITERDLEIAAVVEENEQLDEEDQKSEEELEEDIQKIYEDYSDRVSKNWYDDWLEENGLARYNDSTLSDANVKSMDKAYNEWYDALSDEEKQIVDSELDSGTSRKDVNFEKVYRTPQFSKWYKENYMDTSGTIDGVAHFNSQCITYTGTELDDTIRWTSSNECMLLDGDIEISNSSNGRDSNDNLVLRFEASAKFNEEALKFVNKNVMAIGPNGKDVTDSYVQIEGMFQEEAQDCKSDDVVCTSNRTNETGEGDKDAE